mmetsp:Transcript_78739/g.200415  ORF Transcript_78739/g.200415 Transcript_78739/m.200415 type:complete len:353 (-) Transcript_78739:169-1227(-)
MMHGGAGEVNYEEFIGAFHKVQVQDPQICLMQIRVQMKHLEQRVSKSVDAAIEKGMNELISRLAPQTTGGRDVQQGHSVHKNLQPDAQLGAAPPVLEGEWPASWDFPGGLEAKAETQAVAQDRHRCGGQPQQHPAPVPCRRVEGSCAFEGAEGSDSGEAARHLAAIRGGFLGLEQELLEMRRSFESRLGALAALDAERCGRRLATEGAPPPHGVGGADEAACAGAAVVGLDRGLGGRPRARSVAAAEEDCVDLVVAIAASSQPDNDSRCCPGSSSMPSAGGAGRIPVQRSVEDRGVRKPQDSFEDVSPTFGTSGHGDMLERGGVQFRGSSEECGIPRPGNTSACSEAGFGWW